MATTTYPIADPSAAAAVPIRRMTLEDIRFALKAGWADYCDMRGELIFLGLIYPLVGLVAAFATFKQDLLPLLFPLAAGLSLMGPALASGFYELARRREAGVDSRWVHAFDLFSDRRFWPILTLTALVAVLFAAWIGCAWMIYSLTLGADPAASGAAFLQRLFTTAAGWEMMIAGDVVGLLFATAVLAVSAVSFPMLVDGKVGALTAAETSLRAALANPRVFAAWGLVVAILLVVGSLPLFVGLALVLPTLGYATWHLYRRAVEGGAAA